MFNSNHLHVFVSLARHLHMGRVAEELALTKSAISHSLRVLEADLGGELFDRSGRTLRLTDRGERLRPEAEAILERLGNLRTSTGVNEPKGPPHLRVASRVEVVQKIFPEVLRELRESVPDVTIEITSADTQAAEALIEEGKLDLAVALEPSTRGRARFLPLAEDRLIFLLSPLHPWALRGRVIREDFSSYPMIFPERGSITARLLKSYFRREKLSPEIFMEVDSEEAIKNLVRLNVGIGLTSAWIARSEIEEGTLTALPLGRRKILRQWGILTSRKRPLSFAENLFVGICRSISGSLMGSAF